MSDRPHEATEVHTRLLKCALEVEDSRAYWAHAGEASSPSLRPKAGPRGAEGEHGRTAMGVKTSSPSLRPKAGPRGAEGEHGRTAMGVKTSSPSLRPKAGPRGAEGEHGRTAMGVKASSPQIAFDEYWFGARSLARIEVLLANMRVRYDAFPAALAVLHDWPHMSPETRRTICHWHLQLADPMYREFTGTFLVARREGLRSQVTRDLVFAWVGEQDADRWTMATRIQFASKLLSASHAAGLVTTTRDPRPLTVPRVPDDALAYLLHLLREIEFAGSLLDNPYTRSLGLVGGLLEDRLRGLDGVEYKRQGDLVEFDWRHPSLRAWADANLHDGESRSAGGIA